MWLQAILSNIPISISGIANRTTGNFRGEAWAKAIVNAGINPLTAIMGVENGRLLKNRKLRLIMEAACREAVAVAKAGLRPACVVAHSVAHLPASAVAVASAPVVKEGALVRCCRAGL